MLRYSVIGRLGLATLANIVASAVVGALGVASASAQDAYTVRVEPRPYYGAVITIEEGVRVFRPMPPTRRMIVNPDNATPLTLSIKDVNKRVISRSTNHNYHYNSGPGAASRGPGTVGGVINNHGRFGGTKSVRRGGRAGSAGAF
ncbi:MAG: hypothetical protein AAF732_08400 [Pseudomonadota bacterium]